MKTTLIFVRHAEAEGNVLRIFHGITDSSITEKGHIQAQLVAKRLKNMKIDVLYSSSLKRTLQTAEYISKEKELPIIRTDKLKEINGGDWEGQPWGVLPVKWPLEYDTWENKTHTHKMPNGESMEEFQKRLLNEVNYIIENNRGKNICIVTHGTAIRAMMCYFSGACLEGIMKVEWHENTSISIVEHEDGKFNILLEGDASHLEGDLCTLMNQEWYIKYKEKVKGDLLNEY